MQTISSCDPRWIWVDGGLTVHWTRADFRGIVVDHMTSWWRSNMDAVRQKWPWNADLFQDPIMWVGYISRTYYLDRFSFTPPPPECTLTFFSWLIEAAGRSQSTRRKLTKCAVRYLPSEPCPRCATPPLSCSGSTPAAATKSGPAGIQRNPVSLSLLFNLPQRGGTTTAWWKI